MDDTKRRIEITVEKRRLIVLKRGRAPVHDWCADCGVQVAMLTPDQAAFESSRCLFCFEAPCITACPTHIDVPSFILKIHNKTLKGSARVILDANPLGASCARVCPVEALLFGDSEPGGQVTTRQVTPSKPPSTGPRK